MKGQGSGDDCANVIQTRAFYNRACPCARGSGWHKLVGDYVKQMTASLARPPECGVYIYKQKYTHSHCPMISPLLTRAHTFRHLH